MTLEAAFQLNLGSLSLDVALQAEGGRVLGILGPNGAGKTTCLRVLAGLEAVDAGRVTIGGEVVDEPPARFVAPERRSTGCVFQDYLLFPHLSVVENVAFGPRTRGRGEATREARQWLDRVGLSDLARARPAQLSGGQAQRVALARALAVEPDVLLLDEPMSALDVATRVEVRRDLKRHLAGFPGSTVLVTHDPVDAAVLADDVVVLEHGRVAQRGTMQEVTARPRSRYVAELAGLNLWRGTARDGVVTTSEGATIVGASPLSGAVYVTVPPHAVALYPRRPEGSPRNAWRGRIVSVERFGERARVALDADLPITAEVTLSAIAELHLAGDAEVWASVKATEVDLYPG